MCLHLRFSGIPAVGGGGHLGMIHRCLATAAMESMRLVAHAASKGLHMDRSRIRTTIPLMEQQVPN